MKISRVIYPLCLGFSLWISLAHADISEDMMKFFQAAGVSANVSSAGAYQDQSAGYYTGGNLMLRTQTRNLQPVSIQLPGVRMGCGGIDVWAGSFSHINSEQLVSFLRNVGQNAIGYSAQLAIKTLSPMISGLLTELNHLSTQVNSQNINSCELAATMVGSVWPKEAAARESLCQSMGTNLSVFSDRAQARQGCGTSEGQHKAEAAKKKDPSLADLLTEDYNLVWKALKKSPLFQDPSLAERCMTITGTLIVQQKGDQRVITPLAGKGNQAEFITALLDGEKVKGYHCRPDPQNRCLATDETLIVVSEGFKARVYRLIQSMIQKIQSDQGRLEPAELDLLNATTLPLYKMLNVTAAYTQGTVPLEAEAYVELIAVDVLVKYFNELIDQVETSVNYLKYQQASSTQIDEFLDQLKTLRGGLTLRWRGAYQQADHRLKLIESVQLLEQQLQHTLGQVSLAQAH